MATQQIEMSQTGQVHPTQERKNNLEDYMETQPAGQHDDAIEHHYHSLKSKITKVHNGQQKFLEPTYNLRNSYENRPSDSHTNKRKYHNTSA